MSHSASMTEPAAPSPAPRPVDAQVKRRVWADPMVRFWLLALIAVVLITIGVAINNYRSWSFQRELILHGTPVTATVAEVDGVSRVLNVPPDTPVTLEFTLDGEEHRVQGVLEGRTEYIRTKQTVPIRVDPDNARRWTYATEVPGLLRELAMAQLLLPIVALLVAAVLFWRARILALWKDGHAVAVIVATSRHTALAPFSRYVQATLRDGADKRLIGAYVPCALVDPRRGDILWFIVDDPQQPRQALYAGTFA